MRKLGWAGMSSLLLILRTRVSAPPQLLDGSLGLSNEHVLGKPMNGKAHGGTEEIVRTTTTTICILDLASKASFSKRIE